MGDEHAASYSFLTDPNNAPKGWPRLRLRLALELDKLWLYATSMFLVGFNLLLFGFSFLPTEGHNMGIASMVVCAVLMLEGLLRILADPQRLQNWMALLDAFSLFIAFITSLVVLKSHVYLGGALTSLHAVLHPRSMRALIRLCFPPTTTEDDELPAVGSRADIPMVFVHGRIMMFAFPEMSADMQTSYQNKVASYLDRNHRSRFKVFNVSTEVTYAADVFSQEAFSFGVSVDAVPKLADLHEFCNVARAHLNENSKNLVVLHCTDGATRSGLFAVALLLALDVCAQPADGVAMVRRSMRRAAAPVGFDPTPSQSRLLACCASIMRSPPGSNPAKSQAMRLSTVSLRAVCLPTLSAADMSFTVTCGDALLLNSGWISTSRLSAAAVMNMNTGLGTSEEELGRRMDVIWEGVALTDVVVERDFSIEFFYREQIIAAAWFHTDFVREGELTLPAGQLDVKDPRAQGTSLALQLVDTAS